jgi:hypothetical protein
MQAASHAILQLKNLANFLKGPRNNTTIVKGLLYSARRIDSVIYIGIEHENRDKLRVC